jgi:hypothetical protein
MSSKVGWIRINFKPCVRLEVKQARHYISTCSVASQAFVPMLVPLHWFRSVERSHGRDRPPVRPLRYGIHFDSPHGSMMSRRFRVSNSLEPPIKCVRKARCSIAGLPHPTGYGANRATPCSQFIYKECLPDYYEPLSITFSRPSLMAVGPQ